MRTRTDAERELRRDLVNDGLDPKNYDVASLVDELHDRAGWDFDKVDDADFNAIVARHRVNSGCSLGWCSVDHVEHPSSEHALSIEIQPRIGISGRPLAEPGSVQAAVLYDETEDPAPMLAVAVGQREDAYLTPVQARALIDMLQRAVNIISPFWTEDAEREASNGTIYN